MVATHRAKTPEPVTGNPLGDRWNACVVLLSAVSGFVVAVLMVKSVALVFVPSRPK